MRLPMICFMPPSCPSCRALLLLLPNPISEGQGYHALYWFFGPLYIRSPWSPRLPFKLRATNIASLLWAWTFPSREIFRFPDARFSPTFLLTWIPWARISDPFLGSTLLAWIISAGFTEFYNPQRGRVHYWTKATPWAQSCFILAWFHILWRSTKPFSVTLAPEVFLWTSRI